MPWEFWPAGGTGRPLRITGTSLFYPHCQSNVGLRSDYVASEPVPPASQHHHPKDGMAIAGGPVPVEPIHALPESAPEWSVLSEALSPHVAVAEEGALGAAGQSAGDSRSVTRVLVTQALRAATPLTPVGSWRAAGRTADSTIYYFEAVKRYGPTLSRLGLKSASAPEVFFWGYAHLGNNRSAESYVQAVLVTPARKEPSPVVYTTPLAMLRVEDRPLWVVQRAGFGWEEYAVLDLSRPKPLVLIATFGGGC
jgi:hypothetical protein